MANFRHSMIVWRSHIQFFHHRRRTCPEQPPENADKAGFLPTGKIRFAHIMGLQSAIQLGEWGD